jgi:predicted phosphodiesterase
MESNIIKYKYENGETFQVFLASDLHIDSDGHDSALFKREMKEAIERNSFIILNGDIGDFILPGDRKRWHVGKERRKDTPDAFLMARYEQIYEYLKPYADHIGMICLGNHETSVIRYHGIDPVQWLWKDLNRDRNPALDPIIYGGYFGILRFHFTWRGGGQIRTFDLAHHHGLGGSAEVSRGTITSQRMQYLNVDALTFGHLHTKVVHEMDPLRYMNQTGKIKEKRRFAIITGAYVKNIAEYDIKKGYSLNYGEERMRTPQAQGGAFLHLTPDGAESVVRCRVELT